MHCGTQGPSVYGISQVRILGWVVFPSAGDLPDPGIEVESQRLLHCRWIFFFFFFLPLSHQGSMSQESLNTTNHPSATLERLHQLPSCSPLGISSQSVSLITGPVGQTFDCFWAFLLGFPSGSDSKESASNAGDLGLIPGSGRSPGEGNGYTLQYSCLEKFHGQTAWRATVHRVPRHWIKNINASP